ncbi:MAG: AMP-binding protein [Candidatus Omnitrophota bacterium]|nr:AMP-binding protein [Candidatus Omnitrophota bacterium]
MPQTNNSHIFEVFSETAKTNPQKTAAIFKKNDAYLSLTYDQIYQKSVKFGNLLKNREIKPDDTIAVLLDNRPEYPIAFFAIMYANAVSVPLDIQLPPHEIQLFIFHSECQILITTEKIYSNLKNGLQDLKVILIDSEQFHKELENSKPEDNFENRQNKTQLAVLVYTSGTTNLPKAVMLTQRNLISNVNSIEQLHIIRKEDIIISILPLHHTYPFTVTLLLPLLSGATISYPTGLSSAELLSCIKETKATILVGVPQIYSLIHHSIKEKIKNLPFVKQTVIGLLRDTSYAFRMACGVNFNKYIFSRIHKAFGETLRFMISGGAPLDSEVARDFFKWGFTILEGYGLTETSPAATFNPPEKPKIGSVGKAIPDVEIKIVEPNKEGIGEVLIKGDNVMAGYYNLPRQTKETIKDDWFASGDLGYIDNEGYLYLRGRKKEIIVLSNGKNINPEEIEKHYTQTQFIKEICVLPVKDADYLKGIERLCAVIVIDEEIFKAKNETNIRDKLKWELDNLSVKLPAYKRITGLVITKELLPRTRLGKIMRHKIPEIYAELSKSYQPKEESLKEDDLDILNSETSRNALSLLKQTLDKEVGINDHLELDLGLDSLGRIELLLNLQSALNLEISDEEATGFFMSLTVKDLLLKLKNILVNTETQAKKEKAFIWEKIIRENPSPGTLSKINLKPGIFNILFSLMVIGMFKLIFRVLFLLRVEGRQNLKEKGPYLICPNHTSYFDGLVVLSSLPFKTAINTYFVGYSAIFEHFLLRGFIKTARLIPLELSLNLIEALQACAFVLRNSKIVCYFPEGQRSIDGEIKDFKKGVGILIKELDIPVIPAYIEGSFRAWPRYRAFPKLSRIKIKYGPMITIGELIQEGTPKEKEESYEIIAGNLRKKVAQLKENKSF